MAARASRDVGTVFVSGTESGPGGGIGVRASFGDDAGARPWWSLGAGVGGLAIAGGAAAFPVRVALGVSLAPDSDLGLEASVFNRFVLTSKSGDPSTEYINATGVEIAIRFGR